MAATTFAQRLLRWFDQHRRDLPWRRTRDPWAILVSEIMLQQTRVEAVQDKYARFMARYPAPAAFAAIDDDELLLAWQGLGYYRRARLLRDAARAVIAAHRGALPRDPDALGRLPGIGAYTRGAVASIAFGVPVRAVDGNVERVAARQLALRDDIATAPARRAVAAAVDGWLDPQRPGDFNQALMELGAVVCTPAAPRCERCPVAADCAGRAQGLAERLPVRKPPRTPIAVTSRCLLVPRRGGVLAFRVPAGEHNAGQWELPGPGVLTSVGAGDLAAATARRCGAAFEVGPALATVRHAITHHRIALVAHAGDVARGRAGTLPTIAPDDPDAPWTTVARKVFAAARRACCGQPPHWLW
jgi:A/G-specific adenine glycosylase